MNDQIFETIVCTQSPEGVVQVAPMGVRWRGPAGDEAARAVLMPFKPSTTLANLVAQRRAVVNLVADTRVFAGSVTGRRTWPTRPAERIAGARLANALRHVELEVESIDDHPQRPTIALRRVHEATHAPFMGLNRAQAAVVEGAVLVSRLGMLPREKITSEFAYLQIAIDKTAGPEEHEAWGWLRAAVDAHLAQLAQEAR